MSQDHIPQPKRTFRYFSSMRWFFWLGAFVVVWLFLLPMLKIHHQIATMSSRRVAADTPLDPSFEKRSRPTLPVKSEVDHLDDLDGFSHQNLDTTHWKKITLVTRTLKTPPPIPTWRNPETHNTHAAGLQREQNMVRAKDQ